MTGDWRWRNCSIIVPSDDTLPSCPLVSSVASVSAANVQSKVVQWSLAGEYHHANDNIGLTAVSMTADDSYDYDSCDYDSCDYDYDS